MKPVIVVHGGAGAMAASHEEQEGCLEALSRTLREAWMLLNLGGSALDAVTTAVRLLEDYPGLNAGCGSVLNAVGEAEMDAAVMDGTDGSAGAVAAVKLLKNPVEGARLVMERSPHVLMAGLCADQFAIRHGAIEAPEEYFVIPHRLAQLERSQEAGRVTKDLDEPAPGTVGAVAMDAAGRLAAATSTGGLTNKHPGRIGDSPLIGCGTWASRSCAVSATGDGEFFIRTVFAHEIEAAMRLGKATLEAACAHALERLAAAGGKGGCIAVDAAGKMAMPYITKGMYRGWWNGEGEPFVAA